MEEVLQFEKWRAVEPREQCFSLSPARQDVPSAIFRDSHQKISETDRSDTISDTKIFLKGERIEIE